MKRRKKMKLREQQQMAVDEIVRLLNDGDSAIFFQAPTNWGKTVTAVTLANLYREQGKNIIIATVRNDLVSQFYQTITNIGTEGDATVVVGRSNYIMVDKAIDKLKEMRGTPFESKIEYAEILEFFRIEKDMGKDYVFANDVEREHAKMTDTDVWLIIKSFAHATREDDLPTLKDTSYAITNIFYLVSSLISSRDAISPNTMIILDEVDYFAENVRNFFQEGFSLHNIKSVASYMYYQTGVRTYAKLASKAEQARDTLSDMYRRVIASRGRVRDIDEEQELKLKIMNSVYNALKKLFPNKFLKETITEIMDGSNFFFAGGNGDGDILKQVRELERFLKDAKDKKTGMISPSYSVTFSSVRRYPRVNRQAKTRRDSLNILYSVWRNMTEDNNKVIGFGATISPDFTPKIDRTEAYVEVSKTLSLPKRFDYAFLPLEDIANRKIRNVKVYLSPENSPHFEYGTSVTVMNQWLEYVAKSIRNTYAGGSAMVICKARETSQSIAKELLKLGLDNIVYDQSADMKKALTTFRSKGGILVAHSGLGVGMDAPEIEQLYIAQLPFNIPKTVTDNAKREFVQWIGRLRDDNDKEKSLYILDSRIHNMKSKYVRSMRNEFNYYKSVEILQDQDSGN